MPYICVNIIVPHSGFIAMLAPYILHRRATWIIDDFIDYHFMFSIPIFAIVPVLVTSLAACMP